MLIIVVLYTPILLTEHHQCRLMLLRQILLVFETPYVYNKTKIYARTAWSVMRELIPFAI